MRIYENATSLQREALVAEAVAHVWPLKLIKLPKLAAADFIALKDGRARSLIEIKARTTKLDQYPTLMLSMSKAVALKTVTRETGLPSIIVTTLTDRHSNECFWYWHKLTDLPLGESYRIEVGGRTDRNDAMDVEPVIMIPYTDFKSGGAVDFSPVEPP